MDNIILAIAKRLHQYRIHAGLTQEELAELSGLHNTYIGQVERGEKNITINSLEKILRALGITFSDFFQHIDSDTTNNHVDYSSMCYDIIISKSFDDQQLLYSILSSIDLLSK